MKTVEIWSEYITLGQLLKLTDQISNGAEAKPFLAENMCKMNGEDENRRGRKIRPGDIIEFPSGLQVTIAAKAT